MKIDLHYAIEELVEALLPRHSENKILQINVEADYSIYGKDDESKLRVHIIFLFQRYANYTKVFMKYSERPVDLVAVKTWCLKADHDSCWRDSGVERSLRDLHYKSRRKLQRTDTEAVSDFIHFGFGGPKLFEGKFRPINNDSDCREFTLDLF